MELPALIEEDLSNIHGQSHIEDLDQFFKSVYGYFYHKGVDVITVSVAELTNLALIIFFSSFALLLDWEKLFSDCSPPSRQCNGALSDYVVMPWNPQTSALYGAFILIYISLFLCYLIWKVLRAIKMISEGVQMRRFFEHKLYVNQEDLRVTTWSAILKKLQRLPERLSVESLNLQEKGIAGRIMRKENWLLALIRNNVLDLRIPVPLPSASSYARNRLVTLSKSLEFCLYLVIIEHMYPSGPTSLHGQDRSALHDHHTFDHSNHNGDGNGFGLLEWVPGIGGRLYSKGFAMRDLTDGGTPYFAIRSDEPGSKSSIDEDGEEEEVEESYEGKGEQDGHQFRICEEFLENPSALRSRFVTVGIILLFSMPFMIAFQVMHFLLSNLTEYHSRSAYLGPRVTSHLCRWQNREYNELPHELERRLTRACVVAEDFLSFPMFRDPTLMSLAHITACLSGAMASVLLLLSIYCEGALVGLSLVPERRVHGVDQSNDPSSGHNLLWILGICSAVYAASRAYIDPTNNSRVRLGIVEANTKEASLCENAKNGEGFRQRPGSGLGLGLGFEESSDRRGQATATATEEEGEEDTWKRECAFLLEEWSRLMRLPLPPDTRTISLHDLRFYHSRVSALFPNRLHQFFEELISVISTPLVLLFSLGTEQSCQKIVSFVANHRIQCPVRGDVVSMSLECPSELPPYPGYPAFSLSATDGKKLVNAHEAIDETTYSSHGEIEQHIQTCQQSYELTSKNRRLTLLRAVMKEANIDYSADPAYWRAVAEERLTL